MPATKTPSRVAKPAARTAPIPEKSVQIRTGTCQEFTQFVFDHGVTDHAGATFPGFAGATWFEMHFKWDDKGARLGEKEPVVKYHCSRTDTYYPDAAQCKKACRDGTYGNVGLGGHVGTCKKVTVHTVTATNLTVEFPTDIKVSVLEWQPPEGASAKCLATKKKFDAAVAAHEDHHVGDIKAAVKDAVAKFKANAFKGTGFSRAEAIADLKGNIEKAAATASQELIEDILKRKDKFHATAAGRPFELDCDRCA